MEEEEDGGDSLDRWRKACEKAEKGNYEIGYVPPWDLYSEDVHKY